MSENKTVCPKCGAKLRVVPHSVLDGFQRGSEAPIREILGAVPDDDGAVLTIAKPDGIVNCPKCGVAVARLERVPD